MNTYTAHKPPPITSLSARFPYSHISRTTVGTTTSCFSTFFTADSLITIIRRRSRSTLLQLNSPSWLRSYTLWLIICVMTTSLAKQRRRRRLRNCSDRGGCSSSIRTLSRYVPLPEYFLPWLPLLEREKLLTIYRVGIKESPPSEPFVDLSYFWHESSHSYETIKYTFCDYVLLKYIKKQQNYAALITTTSPLLNVQSLFFPGDLLGLGSGLVKVLKYKITDGERYIHVCAPAHSRMPFVCIVAV